MPNLNFQKDRYDILEIAKNYDENRIKQWIEKSRIRLSQECRTHEVTPCEKCYSTYSEVALLVGCIKGWLKLVQK